MRTPTNDALESLGFATTINPDSYITDATLIANISEPDGTNSIIYTTTIHTTDLTRLGLLACAQGIENAHMWTNKDDD